MTLSPNYFCRRLERSRARMLADIRRRLRGVPLPLAPSELVGLARDGSFLVFDRAFAVTAFRVYGLADLLCEIEAAREENPLCLPVAIVVDGLAHAAWISLTMLSRGGAA